VRFACPDVIRLLGDVQYEHKSVAENASAGETLRFRLIEGPEWLHLDSKTGRMTGTPPAPGVATVRFRVETDIGRSAEQAFSLKILRASQPAESRRESGSVASGRVIDSGSVGSSAV